MPDGESIKGLTSPKRLCSIETGTSSFTYGGYLIATPAHVHKAEQASGLTTGPFVVVKNRTTKYLPVRDDLIHLC